MGTTVVQEDQIEVYRVYCPQTDECYYFDCKRFEKLLCLRVAAPKSDKPPGFSKAIGGIQHLFDNKIQWQL